jgi:phospholipid-binding lipoprotein MlaA
MLGLFAILLVLILPIMGCASTTGSLDPQDPFESYNRAVHKFNQDFDKAIAKPVAEVYKDVVPTPVNKGITNFFSNLDDVVVLINNVLQLKLPQAAQDTARIFFNTTLGLFGFFDVASSLDLPKHREDFGQTLGYWGVPPGPYFVLPFLGPSTIRDSAGLGTDYIAFDPVFRQIDNKTVQWTLFTLDFVDVRADLLGISRLLESAAIDPYLFVREAYLQRRLNYVYDGNPPKEEFEDFE